MNLTTKVRHTALFMTNKASVTINYLVQN